MRRMIKQINFPADLRKFKKNDLKQISDELRDELIDIVSETGGHLGAGLGVVELTVALHYVFDTPKDKLVWDVSHQCYPHKIITIDGESFGVMGDYRLTEKSADESEVIKELEKITWNRIVQVVMLLEEVRTKINNKIKEQV